MRSIFIRIALASLVLALFIPFSSQAAREQRTALVIGNGSYSGGPLKNPVNDATDMAAALQRAGFSVILKKNARQQDMEETIERFGNMLKRGGVGLFYYAGHGLQVNGVNYLVPIGAKINKESDVKYQSIDINKVLDEMANANNGLNIVILDACRDNPYSRSLRSASRGLAIVSNAPTGTFISYSTGPGSVAQDGESRNSPYTAALLKYMRQPGLTIEHVFKNVRADLGKKTGDRQIPWELSSLRGDFYFVPGKSVKAVESNDEQMKIDEEREKLRQEKELLEQKEALAKEKQDVEERKKQLALAEKRRFIPAAKEIKRDGRFIAYNNGTVLDTGTNLMWAARDNGLNIYWPDAKSYCENYRGGGYSDWRMPTQDELAELYDAGKSNNSSGLSIHLTELFHLSSHSVWGSETQSSKASYFNFYFGERGWNSQSINNYNLRALPVRSGK
ncbi:MAG TPA: caspase family protein [Syntrophales bacterium]|nr:caspase family protein [Syntrophales bacterium]